MIKFFRYIRKSLIEQNQMGNYFKYAIGEIILVVIGILIALKINNYNTELGNQTVLKSQLENVVQEVNRNIELLDETIEKSTAIINSSKQMANIIAIESSLSEIEFSKLIGASFAPVLNYQPNNAILNEMILTGSLRNLKNEHLKRMLLELQSHVAELKNQEELHATDQKACIDFILTHGDFKAIMDDTGASNEYLDITFSKKRKGNEILLDSKEFENKLLLFTASGIGLQKGYYGKFKNYLTDIELTIKQELKIHD